MASSRMGGCRGSSSGLRHELLDLSNHLRQERLYVLNEKTQLQDLNEKVKATAEKLSHTAWLAHRQRENLYNLIIAPRGSGGDNLQTIVCLRSNMLDHTSFQDAYKHLSHQEMIYAEFLLTLRSKPKLMATCLTLADRIANDKMALIVSTVFSGLYGSCLLTEDERLVLRLLHHLMKSQLSTSSNPRRLLRQGNCAFSRLYKSFSEELFSAKLFLTSALHEPILSLLSDDEVFLDIDPSKAAIRFPPSEREKKFGKEGSTEYAKKLKQHRAIICSKLEALTNKFIRGIRENLHCFPPSLARLLRAMYSMLMARKVEPRMVNAMCVDVLFSLFICPAIVDPNPVGIIDTPISYIARSNLIQVAQILQVLAMWKWEEIDPKLMDLYSRFDKDALAAVLEAMLDPSADSFLFSGLPGASSSSITSDDDLDLELTYYDDAMANIEAGAGSESVGISHSTRLSRLAVLLTRDELENLITVLRALQGHQDLSEVDASELATLLDPLPDKLPINVNLSQAVKHKQSTQTHNSKGPGDETSAIASMIAKRQLLSNRLSTAVNAAVKRSSSLTASTPNTTGSDDLLTGQGEPPGVIPFQQGSSNNSCDDGAEALDESALLEQCEPDMVMVIPLPDRHLGEPPGFLSEEHVITRCRQASRVVRMNLANLPGGEDEDVDDEVEGAQGNVRRNSHGNATVNSEENSSMGPTGEKRTRFSLSHDDGSIGNTSDNLEAISEAASDHSVASSLEDEPDDPDAEDPINDNLSDMVSANVSWRGTPNVSGRDTPSSQVTEDGGEEAQSQQQSNEQNISNGGQNPQIEIDGGLVGGDAAPPGSEEEEPRVLRIRGRAPPTGRKSGEPDLEEKFGRFEIKPPPRSCHPTTIGGHPGIGGSINVSSEQGDETVSMVSDTWSTDVLASDTDTTMGDSEERAHHRRHRVRLPDDGAGSVASSSAANLLDVAETASEAWSMDVLASDTESLRLAELDNEDSGSVARSDDTRFTDDTTRSDPADLGVYGASSSKRMFGAESGSSLRPSRAAAVEQWARQSSGHAPRLGSTSSIQRRGSDTLGARPNVIEGSILKKPPVVLSTSNGGDSSSEPNNSVTNINNNARLLSHPSAASIASSTESSAGDSATGALSSSKEQQPKQPSCETMDGGEVEVITNINKLSEPPVASNGSAAKEDTTPGGGKKPPMSNTGAIPKSISFDKAVVINRSRHSKDDSSPVSSSSEIDQLTRDLRFNGDQEHHPIKSGNSKGGNRGDKSFFKSWKLPKIGRHRGGGHSGSSGKNGTDVLMSSNSDEQVHLPEDGILVPSRPSAIGADQDEATPDEILAKYRSKPKTSNEAELSTSNEVILSSSYNGREAANELDGGAEIDDFDDRLIIDPHNVDASYAFQDAKRKLRMMLSEADLSLLTSTMPLQTSSREAKTTNDLVALLRVQLAEAHNLQDRNLVAQLHETLRCLSLFDNDSCRRLVRSLREDYKRRSPYLSYLVRCRQGLLATLAHQRRLLSRMEADRSVCWSHQINVCIRMFLEKREKQMLNFVTNFRESCTASDEKIALMERFLAFLWSQLEADTSLMLLTANSPTQLEMCRVAIERAVVAHIYVHAMYPNGEADISRDGVLAEHINKLASEITPNHRDLRISRQFHYESPWPSAQVELRQLAAFKTPKDKVACVVRSSQTIMNLLSLSAKNSVPAADDFLPVLVFVVVKANPPSLLSTVQYVDSFYGNRLSGEDHYWWMQFVAAVEFIKTMDYN